MKKNIFFRPESSELFTLGDAIRVNPDVTLTTDEIILNEMGFFRMEYSPIPSCLETQEIVEINPEFVDGKYVHRYEVKELFTVEKINQDGSVISIEEQRQQYIKSRVAARRINLRETVLKTNKNAVDAGIAIQYGSTANETDTFNLDSDSLLGMLLNAQLESGQILIGRNGAHPVTKAAHDSVLELIANRYVQVKEEARLRMAALEAAQTHDDLDTLELQMMG